ncbi:MAG: riboflavin biosynthesis protein RibF [Bacilli bacterium]|nr:riboflavin biosynthesis protein RibF [Bacilli bacterium]
MAELIYLDKEYVRRDEQDLSLVLGYFDGLHLGHLALFEEALRLKEEKGNKTAVLLFDSSPAKLLNNGKTFKCLTSLGDKIGLLESIQVDVIYLVHIDMDFLSLSKDEFLDMVEYSIRATDVVVGEDYTFGKKAEGRVDYLKERYGENAHIVSLLMDNGLKISSRDIIKAIEGGNITLANSLLGRDYSIVGTVVKGLQNGRTIGFPTANLSLLDDYALPKVGVYGGSVMLENGDIYPSIINVGTNPTVKEDVPVHVEAYLDGFEGDIYNQNVMVFFNFFIREETTFDSLEDLKAQLSKDINLVR